MNNDKWEGEIYGPENSIWFLKTCVSILRCIYWHYIKYKEISIW